MRDICTVADNAPGKWTGNYQPILSPGEEADLIRQAKIGHEPSKRKLLDCYHRLILKIAVGFAGNREDLTLYGAIGLLTAVDRYDCSRNNGLYAFAIEYIKDAIRTGAKRLGDPFAGETRIERFVRSHPYDSPEWIADTLNCSVKKAEKALDSFHCRRGIQTYSTTFEGGFNEDIDGRERASPRNAMPSYEARRHFDCFSPHQLSPQLRLHEAVSRKIDALAADLDKRGERRLKAMGRREYALWLVRRERVIEDDRRRLSETNHWLYGNRYRPEMPARPVKRKRNRVRRTHIRVWRCYEQQAAMAA
jgi:hypothetical protein